MSMFKKRTAALLLACVLLTGCGENGSISDTDSVQQSSVSEPSASADESSEAEGTATKNEQSGSLSEQISVNDDSSRSDENSKQSEDSASEGTTVSAEQSSTTQTSRSTASGSGTTATTASTAKTDSGAKTTASQTTSTDAGSQKDPGFGAKWSNLFTTGGDPVVKSDAFPYSYKSEDVNVQLTKQKYGDSEYYIADIHIRYIDSLRSAFSINRATGEEEYGAEGGANYQEDGAKLSERVHSILTINGDYYSGRKSGIIFRNGQLYRNIPRAEIGAVYRDGTYKGFAKDDFDVTAEQNKGLWQVMGFEPRLVENGKAISDIKTLLAGMDVAAPRSGFGYYEPGHYCFVVADGRREDSVGPELQEWANFFETLGCEGAFNLDGGASSQMYFMGKLVNQPTTGTSGGVIRMLPDVFYIGEVG